MVGPDRNENFTVPKAATEMVVTTSVSSVHPIDAPRAFDPLSTLAAQEVALASLTAAKKRSTAAIKEGRKEARERYRLARIAEQVYENGFLKDTETAIRTATALASRDLQGIGFDRRSLGAVGESEESVLAYLSKFTAFDPTQQYLFPKLEFPTTAVMQYEGRDMILPQHSSLGRALDRADFINFPADVTLPMLIDPIPRSFARFDELEALDPGHAGQLRKAYTMAAQSLYKDDNAIYQAPQIVRLVALLPVGENYSTAFTPEVETREKGQAWNPFLMLQGKLNESGNFLTPGFFGKSRIPANRDGRESGFRIGQAGSDLSEAQAQSEFPLGSRELDSMGIFLFPYAIKERPYIPYDYSYDSLFRGAATRGGSLTYGGGASKGMVGGAEIYTGPRTMWSTEKRHRTWDGNEMSPQFGGIPTIYSVRLLAVSRTPSGK